MKRILSYLVILSSLTLASTATAEFPSRSSKRGLVYIPNSKWPNDYQVWTKTPSDLSWYYNYDMYPSQVYQNDTNFEFVPQLWGAPSSVSDTTFLQNVTGQIVEGNNITYVMGFNEPDGTFETGGSNILPADAAYYWIEELEPLRKLGVSLGAPAVTGAQSGFTWLSDFMNACEGNCTFDFIPIHWYGSFDGLASHIGEVMDAYPAKAIWVTEFALPDASLNDTQSFFETCCQYFDQNPNITHYSYFGSFRSAVSNVGVNAAMMNSNGSLTDIGSWYLGGNGTGVKPDNISFTPSPGPTSSPTPTYTLPPLATHYSAGHMCSLPNCLMVGLFVAWSWSTLLP